jgi:hypothetical protein
MLESDARRQIEASIEALEDLRARFDQLLCGQNPTYIDFCAALDEDASRRLLELDRLRVDERANAERHFDGFLYAERHSHDHEALGASGNVLDFIRCKYSLVKASLPHPTEYFALFTKCPFIGTLTGRAAAPGASDASLTLSPEPIAEVRPARVIPKCCSVRAGVLTIGAKAFERGSQAVLVVGKGRPVQGIIGAVRDGAVEFDTGERIVRIPIVAFSLHQCKLKKR